MAQIEDIITYLEMLARPSGPRPPPPLEMLALMRAENCTVSFYRYLYETVGERWLWYERRRLGDTELAGVIGSPTVEIHVLYVRGVPAGFFEFDVAEAQETRLSYLGLVPEFIGRGFGAYLLQAAIDCAWLRPIARLWLTTSHFDHPKALRLYQRGGFVVYAQRRIRFEDPRLQGFLPRTLSHPLLPPLEPAAPPRR
jgi:GNAT superfamily N-acetyltransferase